MITLEGVDPTMIAKSDKNFLERLVNIRKLAAAL